MNDEYTIANTHLSWTPELRASLKEHNLEIWIPFSRKLHSSEDIPFFYGVYSLSSHYLHDVVTVMRGTSG